MGNSKKLADFAGCGERRRWPVSPPDRISWVGQSRAERRPDGVQMVVWRSERGREHPAGQGNPRTAGEDRPAWAGRIRTPEGCPDAGRTVRCDRPSTAGPESTAGPGPGYLRSDRHGAAVRGYPRGGYLRVVSVYARVVRGCHDNDGGTLPRETWLKASVPARPRRAAPAGATSTSSSACARSFPSQRLLQRGAWAPPTDRR